MAIVRLACLVLFGLTVCLVLATYDRSGLLSALVCNNGVR